ncbi:MAG: ribulose-phosphate 3-epimerase [Planctomycetota bacterium]
MSPGGYSERIPGSPEPRIPRIRLGAKTDPIERRHSFAWLFRILAEEKIPCVQLGTFFELYQLPDSFFRDLRARAADFGLEIASVFTSHRELGGFFLGDPAWEAVARRSFERLIDVAGLVGARTVGSNPGSVPRDLMELKAAGISSYLRHAKELLRRSRDAGLSALLLEPMSCAAEPPSSPEEIRAMLEDLLAYHRASPEETAAPGVCFDVSHGFADREGVLRHSPLDLLEAAVPYVWELHLKNTDARFEAAFGFGEAERKRGVVDLAAVRNRLLAAGDRLPVREVIAYLELPGPKLGRDASDARLEAEIRESLRHIRQVFAHEPVSPARPGERDRRVLVAPSLMCADAGYLAEEIRRLEELGADWLHFDVMDGRFVPNLPLGLGLIRDARRLTALPFDVHLMVRENDLFVDLLASIGVERISVHAESAVHLDRTLERIRQTGARAGVALNPATPLSALDYVLERLDYLLLMTVNPGYAGQKLVPSAIRKIADARAYLERRELRVPIEVDGNVSFEHIPRMVAAGADVLVAGSSSLYRAGRSRAENFARLERAVREGLELRGDRGAPEGGP